MDYVVRFAPSPTGVLHIGGVQVALFNYLFAKRQGGKFCLRMEDTDLSRNKKEFEDEILDSLNWLGFDFDGDIIYQSRRSDIYREYLKKLVASGHAYFCFCSKNDIEKQRENQKSRGVATGYDGTCRDIDKNVAKKRVENGESFVVRLRVPENKKIVYEDMIHGEIVKESNIISDFVVSRGFDSFLYNFTNVVDDADMKISHVLRGDDHISNTFKQILIYEALDLSVPRFGHIPLLLTTDKKKISKRHNTPDLPTTVSAIRKKGVLPNALINFLALLGWNLGGGSEKEFFKFDELLKVFSIENIGSSASVYDIDKLAFFNSHYIRELRDEDFAQKILPYLKNENWKIPDNFVQIASLIKTKLKFFSEAVSDLRWFFDYKKPEIDLVLNKKMKVDESVISEAISIAKNIFENDVDFSQESLRDKFIIAIKEKGFKNGQILWPVRAILTGEQFSPGAFEVASVLGKKECLRRIG